MQSPLQEQTRQRSSPERGEPEASSLLGLISQPPAMVERSAATIIGELNLLKPGSVERTAISSALLALLSDQAFGRFKVNGRVLRHEVVEAVLRLGYPAALQLEPADVAALRARAPRLGRMGSIHVVAFAVAALVGAVAGTTVVEAQPVEPGVMETAAPTAAEDDHLHDEFHRDYSRFAVPVARRVAELRHAGQLVEALAVAEGCVVAFETPAPCVEELLLLPPEPGDPDRALYRRRQWVLLAGEPGAVVRARARDILINDFAREASLEPPVNAWTAQGVMSFIEQCATLEHEGQGKALAEKATGCAMRADQVGTICRSFLARAEALRGE